MSDLSTKVEVGIQLEELQVITPLFLTNVDQGRYFINDYNLNLVLDSLIESMSRYREPQVPDMNDYFHCRDPTPLHARFHLSQVY